MITVETLKFLRSLIFFVDFPQINIPNKYGTHCLLSYKWQTNPQNSANERLKIDNLQNLCPKHLNDFTV